MINKKNVRKNYTLYINYKSNKIKLFSGSMEEIDDFTSYFLYPYAIKKRLLESNYNTDLYIESSKGNRYDLAFYNVRSILNKDNFNKIFEKVKKISSNRIDEYFFLKCNLDKCLQSPNADSIPIVRIHRIIEKNENYLDILYNYFNADYKAFRNFVIYFFKGVNLNKNAKNVPLLEKEQVLSVIENMKNILSEIKESDEIIDENTYMDDYANNIVNNELMDEEEKIKELEMLFNDSEIVNKYKGKI